METVNFIDFFFCFFFSKNIRSRSSRPDVFYKKRAFENFSKFTRKHMCQSVFFDKVAGLRPLEHLWWLFLS